MAKQITEMTRGYATPNARRLAIRALARAGYNYFVPYKDTQSDFALQFGVANWVPAGQVHVDGGLGWGQRGPRKYPRCSRPFVHRP